MQQIGDTTWKSQHVPYPNLAGENAEIGKEIQQDIARGR